MSRLIKPVTTTYVPGDPGHPAVPATLAHDGYWIGAHLEQLCTHYVIDPITFVSHYVDPALCVYTDTIIPAVYVPAVVASPGIPAQSPTPAQINASYNVGWNSYASTVDPLTLGSYLEFSVKLGTQAALVAVGYEGLEGYPIDYFTNGIMVDVSGIHVFESGVVVATLGVNQAGTVMRIARLADGRILYALDTGAVHISAAAPLSTLVDLAVYGMLYRGYDEVSAAEFLTGSALAEPEATLTGTGSLVASTAASARLTGEGVLTAYAPPSASMSGVGTMLASVARGGVGHAALPYLCALGGDTEYAIGYATLPALTATAVTTSYSAPIITYGYANLPELVSYAHGDNIDFGSASAQLPALQALGGDYAYGFASGELPYLVASGYGGMYPADTIPLISDMVMSPQFTITRDIVLVLTSSGVLESAQVMTRQLALALLSGIIASTPLSMLGVYGYSLISEAAGLSLQSLSAQDRPDLNTTGVVWVVNRETNSSTQYEQFGFNSFFQRNSDYYGVANDGIYLLDGDTDAGFPILALAEMGRTNLGYTAEKRVHQVLLGVGSDSELYLKVDVDEQTYVYSMRSSGTAVRTRPVDIGWGVKGDYWDFTLLNPNGVDFELASVSFYPVPLARRG